MTAARRAPSRDSAAEPRREGGAAGAFPADFAAADAPAPPEREAVAGAIRVAGRSADRGSRAARLALTA